MACNACGETDIEHDSSKGMSYCTSCGEVCEENTIVSEVTFGEAASGAAIVQGSFVRAGQTRANMTGPGRHGSGQESREMTLYNSRRRIQRLATALGLSEHYIDSAQRYFTLALNHGFTRGRRSVYVASACLYIVCRMEKNSQMLIDFSDVLQVSVFKLGATFAKLVNVLNLQLPIVEPSLYITRFASMLEFGDKAKDVILDATRLVQRMDRDWIRTGRRPSGICGACLLISARMHNFRRTQREIIRVVKIADTTLRNRLDEFSKTPSSQLSVNQFRSLWLEQASDPPAFTKGRLKARKTQLEQQKLLGEDGEDEESIIGRDGYEEEVEESEVSAFEKTVEQAFQKEFNHYFHDNSLKLITSRIAVDDFSPDVSTWSDIDDDEVNNIMLTEEEVKEKTEIWDRENKEFVEEQERKRQAKEVEMSTRKRRKSTKRKLNLPAGETPFESAQQMLAMRRLSKKINYEVLEKLLGNDSTVKTRTEPSAGYSNMIPSGAPSRMLSTVGTPTGGSGATTPTQPSMAASGQDDTSVINRLPTALAGIDSKEQGIVVYEEGDQDNSRNTGTAVADVAEDEDDEEEEEEEDFELNYSVEYGEDDFAGDDSE